MSFSRRGRTSADGRLPKSVSPCSTTAFLPSFRAWLWRREADGKGMGATPPPRRLSTLPLGYPPLQSWEPRTSLLRRQAIRSSSAGLEELVDKLTRQRVHVRLDDLRASRQVQRRCANPALMNFPWARACRLTFAMQDKRSCGVCQTHPPDHSPCLVDHLALKHVLVLSWSTYESARRLSEPALVAAAVKFTCGADLRLPLPINLDREAAASCSVAITGSVGGWQNPRKRVNERLVRTGSW